MLNYNFYSLYKIIFYYRQISLFKLKIIHIIFSSKQLLKYISWNNMENSNFVYVEEHSESECFVDEDDKVEIYQFDECYPVNGIITDFFLFSDQRKNFCNNNGKLREKVEKLDIDSEYRRRFRSKDENLLKFNRNLNLTNFINLVYLDCSNNSISVLDLSDCRNLKILAAVNNELKRIVLPEKNRISFIRASSNNLEDFEYWKLNSKYLSILSLARNKLKSNISVFSKLYNLKSLYLSNNFFFGSLKLLNNLKKLKGFSYYNNEIIPSLEFIDYNISAHSNLEELENLDEFNLSYMNIIEDKYQYLDKEKSTHWIPKTMVKRRQYFRKFWELKKDFLIIKRLTENELEYEEIFNNIDLVMKSVSELKTNNKSFNFRFKNLTVNKKGNEIYSIKSTDKDLFFLKDVQKNKVKSEIRVYNEGFLNHSNGFLKWLIDEFYRIREIKMKFYWKLISFIVDYNVNYFDISIDDHCKIERKKWWDKASKLEFESFKNFYYENYAIHI